jgi:hypothetical protein
MHEKSIRDLIAVTEESNIIILVFIELYFSTLLLGSLVERIPFVLRINVGLLRKGQ